MRLDLDTIQDSRQARLASWLAARRVGPKDFADPLGIDASYVSKIFKGDRQPLGHIQKLIELGVPAELLPEPNSGKPGPKPKAQAAA